MKELLATLLARRVRHGEVVGLGTGSTAELVLRAIGKRVRETGLSVLGVPTSQRTAVLAAGFGITVVSPLAPAEVSWAFDGADEVDDRFMLIKGRGGAMLNEKIIAERARTFVVVVSEEKLVTKLGVRGPVPIEVVPSAVELVREKLAKLGAVEAELRQGDKFHGPVITEHGNVILDVRFPQINPELEGQLKSVTGVVESGIFTGHASEILIAGATEVRSRTLVSGNVQEKVLQ